MTFLELMLFTQKQSETLLYQDINSLITDKHLYTRIPGDSEGWVQDPTPGRPEKLYTKSGDVWRWKRDEPTE